MTAVRLERAESVDGFDLSDEDRTELRLALGPVEVVSVEILERLGPNALAAETVVRTPDGRLHTSLSLYKRREGTAWRLGLRLSRPALDSLDHAMRRFREREARRRTHHERTRSRR